MYFIYNIYICVCHGLASKGYMTSLQMNVYYDEIKCDGTIGKHWLERSQLSRVQLKHLVLPWTSVPLLEENYSFSSKKVEGVSHSAVSDSLQPHGLQPTRLLCLQDFLGKNTGVGSHSLLQRIFPTQGPNPGLLHTAGRFFTLGATSEAHLL